MTTPRNEQETILSYDWESHEWHYYSNVPKHNRRWADLVQNRTQFVEKNGTIEVLEGTINGSVYVGGNESKSGRSNKDVSGQETGGRKMSEEKLYAVKIDEGKYGGHVVTLVEEPEKVVLTKEQAKIVDDAHDSKIPACHIANESDDEELLINAYVNGYTVAKEKKYNVKVPHAEKTLYRKHDSGALFASIYVGPQNHANDFLFTAAEIEHYGLQDCEKEEVTDDEQ